MELFSDYKFLRLVYNTAVVFVRQDLSCPADLDPAYVSDLLLLTSVVGVLCFADKVDNDLLRVLPW